MAISKEQLSKQNEAKKEPAGQVNSGDDSAKNEKFDKAKKKINWISDILGGLFP